MNSFSLKIKRLAYIHRRSLLVVLIIVVAALLTMANFFLPEPQSSPETEKNIFITARLNPAGLSYDPKIMVLQIENFAAVPLKLVRIRLANTDKNFSSSLVFDSDHNGTLDKADQAVGPFAPSSKKNLWEVLPASNAVKIPLSPDKITLFVKFDETPLNLDSLAFRFQDENGTTPQNIFVYTRFVNDATNRYRQDTINSPADFINSNPQFSLVSQPGSSIVRLGPGSYNFSRTVIIPNSVSQVQIAPGTTLTFDPGVSLISYAPIDAIGDSNKPISFLPSSDKSWGVFAIVENHHNVSHLDHVMLKGGGSATLNGAYFSAGLSAYYSDVEIQNSTFTQNSLDSGDDGVNVKSAHAIIQNSQFLSNNSDGLDLDFVSGQISHNLFENNGNDGVDVSFNTAVIENNISRGNKDKCISVGEQSRAPVRNNQLIGCNIGVAVKESKILVAGNSISQNVKGVSIYTKKFYFGKSSAELKNNVFTNNTQDVFQEKGSEVVYSD